MAFSYQLPWNLFSWQDFQQLTLLLAELVFPGTHFEEYLKQGATQEGIDLISTKYENGKTTTIQCKKEKKWTDEDLNDIITVFLKGEHADNCSRFVIATIADLQHKKLQKSIAHWKKKLHDHNKIELEVWDRNSIEKLLLGSWRLTARYFGKEAADIYCIPEVFNPDFPEVPAIVDYIPRKITGVSDDEMSWYSQQQLVELKDLILGDDLKAQRIGILGSPYFGKTTYLKQTAYLLRTSGQRLHPLFLEVKNVSVQPIENLLNARFGEWKSLPFRSLVLIIDGLDEIRTDRFNDMIRNIHTFSQKYHTLHIVISCRRLFYEKYQVNSILKNFSFFELFRLEYDDVQKYLKNTLGGQYAAFMKKINRHKLENSLYHPFYIENLVGQYKKYGTLPKSKIEVVENFINNAFEISKQRQLAGGENLRGESVLFAKVIKRFALALQIAGLNALNDEQIQGLFNPLERELLQHNSMVNANSEGWSFTNAMFQEHFAALALTFTDIETIIRISSVGIQIRKIKMKWLQTLASLLSILDESKPLFTELLAYSRQDNIELLFIVEPMKFPKEFRLGLLKEVIEKVAHEQVRPIVAGERTIGEFVNGIDEAVNYLFEHLKNDENTWVVKVVCCDILQAMNLGVSFHDPLRTIVRNESTIAVNSYYVSNLINILLKEKAADNVILDQLVKLERFANDHQYRQRVYELIAEAGMADSYYDYALEGIEKLIDYNRSITHSGSEYTLENVLLSTNNYVNIRKLFKVITSKEWIEKHRYASIRGRDFLKRLLEKCARLFPVMPRIIFPIIEYMKMMGMHYLRETYDEFDTFFSVRGTEFLGLQIVLPDLLKDVHWQIGAHITKPMYDYLLFELEENNAGLKEIRNVMYGLRFRKEKEGNNEFWQLCDDMLGGELKRDLEKYNNDLYNKAEEIKRANDKLYLSSRANYRKGIINFFKLYGKKSLDTEDLFIEPKEDLKRNKFDSNFLFKHFIDCKREDANRVTMKTCLKLTDDEEWFNFYRVSVILHDNTDPDLVYIEIAKNYFETEIVKVDLANSYWDEGKSWRWFRKHDMIGKLFEKFEFDVPEGKLLDLLWLDHGGLRSWEHENTNHCKSIAQIVVEKVGEPNIGKLKDKVLENIKHGIKSREVLGTHFSLVRRFKITAAKDFILEHILKGTFDQYLVHELSESYLELGGELDNIASYFSSLTDYTFYSYWKISEFLLLERPEVARKSLHTALASGELSEDNQVTASMFLSSLGEIDAFEFLTKRVELTRRSPYFIQGKTVVQNVDTSAALKFIEPIMFFVVDPTYSDNSGIHDSARNIIVEWIFGFAAKSEADMMTVLEFLYKQIEVLKARFPEHANLLHFYANKILEDFRSSDKKEISTDDILVDLKILGQA